MYAWFKSLPGANDLGIAQCQPVGGGIEALLARAGKAMRQAKKGGRDRLVVDHAAS